MKSGFSKPALFFVLVCDWFFKYSPIDCRSLLSCTRSLPFFRRGSVLFIACLGSTWSCTFQLCTSILSIYFYLLPPLLFCDFVISVYWKMKAPGSPRLLSDVGPFCTLLRDNDLEWPLVKLPMFYYPSSYPAVLSRPYICFSCIFFNLSPLELTTRAWLFSSFFKNCGISFIKNVDIC